MSNDNPVRLTGGGVNYYGTTFWDLKIDTNGEGRGQNGLQLNVNIQARPHGLFIAGNYLSWDDLHKAEEYAKKKAREIQTA